MTIRYLSHSTANVGFRHRWIAAVLIALAVPVSSGQVAAPGTPPSSSSASDPYVPTMTFDIISVRESKPDLEKGFAVGGGFAAKTGSLTMTNNSIRNMLALAFGLSWHQLQGLPDWTNRPMYNVAAKSDDAADEKLATLTPHQISLEHQHMMQALLAERFNLKTHWTTQEAPVYNLVVAKGGAKMQPGGSLPPSAQELTNFGDRKLPEIYQSGNGRRGYEFIGHNCHMASLAATLVGLMATDVIDKTGLTAAFDFDLQYSQASDTQRDANSALWPSVPDALQDQLGLKLEHAKGSVKMLVVDHIDPPSPN